MNILVGFADRVAFAHALQRNFTTGNRESGEVLGRNGML